MCCCAKPTINGQPGYSWDGKSTSTYPVDPPELQEGDTLLFDEPGRCGGHDQDGRHGTDSHCLHLRLVRNCGLALLVKHGAGQERIRVSTPPGVDWAALDSNTRYWILASIWHAHDHGRREGVKKETLNWTLAAMENRIKVKKMRNHDQYSVRIVPKESAFA